MRLSHLLLVAIVLGSRTGVAWSQLPATDRTAVRPTTIFVVMPFEFAAPVPAQPQVVRSPRPSVWPAVIMPASGLGHNPNFAPRLAHAPAQGPAGSHPGESTRGDGDDPIGIGIADLLIARLLDVPGIRVVERHRLDLLTSERQLTRGDTSTRDTITGILRARYIITGSVMRFGTEVRRGLGGVGGGFGLGVLGFKRPKTQVALTARIVDAVTGEIIVSIAGAGTSTKGGSVLVGGAAGGIGGGVAIGSDEFRASALGEATERAVDALARDILAKQGRLGGS